MMILGGIKKKYDRSSWIVLSGVILLFISIVLVTLFTRLGGLLLSFTWFPVIFIFIGLGCVVGGALTNDK